MNRWAPLLIILASTFAVQCFKPIAVEAYGIDGIKSINGFDLFEAALEDVGQVSHKGYMEEEFFVDQQVILYLDRRGSSDALQPLSAYLDEISSIWEEEEYEGRPASILILLRDTDASVALWHQVALDMPDNSEERTAAEKQLAYRIFSDWLPGGAYLPFLGVQQSMAPEEGNLDPRFPIQRGPGFGIQVADPWPGLDQWYPPRNHPVKESIWYYNPHWRSEISSTQAAQNRFGKLPPGLQVRRYIEEFTPASASRLGFPLSPEALESFAKDATAIRRITPIIEVAGRPLLLRIEYGEIPVYIMASSEMFVNYSMARPDSLAFLHFLLHAVNEKPDKGDLRITYIERGLVPAEQQVQKERSLAFLLAEKPWGLILFEFMLVLFVFLWSRFPHDRTPLQPEESGSRHFREHFEALGARLLRSRDRTQAFLSLIRLRRKNPDQVFPEWKQNARIKEDVVLNRIRKLWE